MASQRSSTNRGSYELARERLRLEAPVPPPLHERQPRDILPELVARMRRQQEHWTRDLANRWPELAGQPWQHGTRPGPCRHQVLTVFVNHSIRLHELERRAKKELLQRLQKAFGLYRIRSLRLQLDPEVH